MPSLVNRELLGRYRLLSRLGGGAHAEVWKAHDAVRGGAVALKLYHEGGLDVQRAEAAKQFSVHDCASVLPLLDVQDALEGQITTMPLMVQTLADRAESGLRARDAIDAVQTVLTALEFCHGRNTTHGDVKPSNVFENERGELLLGDFGGADWLGEGHAGFTLAYAAPELLQGGRSSSATDTWATAALLYELLCGEMPFGTNDEQPVEILASRVAAGVVRPPDHIRPYLPRRLRLLFKDAFCAEDPAARPICTPRDLKNALSDVHIAAEWIPWQPNEDELERWEGRELRSDGSFSGVVYKAFIRKRGKRAPTFEAVVNRSVGGRAARAWAEWPPERGTAKQARQRLHDRMRALTAGNPPRR
jgi:serine/threonine protein kinase